ncbi:hypothetical protein DPMN_148832 [Dreissena polymorpha]|uniref:Uncharacterized protein n=1 Tax=Dreissena polymorpha TaxID=45954 RepID=A0A9D4FD95_DREPO|nr:hypothetical protein DPMN_148832 [Dreissena polymorpha]
MIWFGRFIIYLSIYLSIYTAKRPLEHYRQRDIIESVSWEEPVLGVYGGDNENAPRCDSAFKTSERSALLGRTSVLSTGLVCFPPGLCAFHWSVVLWSTGLSTGPSTGLSTCLVQSTGLRFSPQDLISFHGSVVQSTGLRFSPQDLCAFYGSEVQSTGLSTGLMFRSEVQSKGLMFSPQWFSPQDLYSTGLRLSPQWTAKANMGALNELKEIRKKSSTRKQEHKAANTRRRNMFSDHVHLRSNHNTVNNGYHLDSSEEQSTLTNSRDIRETEINFLNNNLTRNLHALSSDDRGLTHVSVTVPGATNQKTAFRNLVQTQNGWADIRCITFG